jgi:hypothetical protein
MKREIIKIVRIMGICTTELVMDFELSIGIFNTIEWMKEDNSLWLHAFEGDLQMSVDFDDLERDDKMEIYVVLRSILYN